MVFLFTQNTLQSRYGSLYWPTRSEHLLPFSAHLLLSPFLPVYQAYHAPFWSLTTQVSSLPQVFAFAFPSARTLPFQIYTQLIFQSFKNLHSNDIFSDSQISSYLKFNTCTSIPYSLFLLYIFPQFLVPSYTLYNLLFVMD